MEEAGPGPDRDDAALRRSIAELVDAVPGVAAVYARRLDRDEVLRVGPVDDAFPTGSAAKYAVLLAYAAGVADGSVARDRRVEIGAPYRDARKGSGVLRFLDAGLAPTLHDCATLMMIVSDNVATDLLLDALGGPAAVNEVVARLGCDGLEVTSPTVWVLPPKQFGMASPRGLAEAWSLLSRPGPVAELCRAITWRHQSREGFARLVPFNPDLPDFDIPSKLGLWAKAGSYPSVSCEAGLFDAGSSSWVVAVMAKELTDWGNGSTSVGPTLRAQVSKALYDAWR